MELIKRFFECLLPVTACNLKCEYCYVIQRNYRNMEIPTLKYSPEWIGQALNKKRIGGVAFFSICGAGETLIPDYVIDIVYNILKQGHIVNITTNGTLTKRFKELSEFPEDYRKRLNISFSLHYDELKNKNLLNVFSNNVNIIKKAGISFLVQLNLCDSYIEKIEEIKKFSMENFGAYPQIAATRKESRNLKRIELDTKYSQKEYLEYGSLFNSNLFIYTMKNFNVKRKEFCYAGDWSGTLNLETGRLSKCYADPGYQDIFSDLSKPIKFEAIGKNCKSKFCFNSSHFMSLGVIPQVDTDITYCNLRDREEAGWYNDTLKELLNHKLVEANIEYSKGKKIIISQKSKIYFSVRGLLSKVKRMIK